MRPESLGTKTDKKGRRKEKPQAKLTNTLHDGICWESNSQNSGHHNQIRTGYPLR